MRKTILDEDGFDWKVINLETGNEILGVQWADDETGDYFELAVDLFGNPMSSPCDQNNISGGGGNNLYVWCRGKIKLVKVENK